MSRAVRRTVEILFTPILYCSFSPSCTLNLSFLTLKQQRRISKFRLLGLRALTKNFLRKCSTASPQPSWVEIWKSVAQHTFHHRFSRRLFFRCSEIPASVKQDCWMKTVSSPRTVFCDSSLGKHWAIFAHTNLPATTTQGLGERRRQCDIQT